MDLALAFVFFAANIIFVLYRHLPMSLAMCAGFVAFFCVGLNRKFAAKSLLSMSLKGAAKSLIVVRVLLTIGILTGLWRCAGTFAILTAWGLRAITPEMFILSAFILSCILSYALGTSFGTVGTLGIALMMLARSGGVNEVLTAGAIMSGIHFGDRGSPSSSCAHLVTALTSTELYNNIRAMMKSALLPLILSIAFYSVLSLRNPLINFHTDTLDELAQSFNLNPVVISPALLMLALPLFRVNIFVAFLVSIIAAFACTIFVQGYDILGALSCAIFGFHSDDGIKTLFNGGGFTSMIQTCLVLAISGTFSGIFEGTGILDQLQEKLSQLIKISGSWPVVLTFGTMMNAIFCNQTVGIMMTAQLLRRPCENNNIENKTFALDISNSTVITAPLIPWCIACSVPLSIMGTGIKSLLCACYLYLIPICYTFTRKNSSPRLHREV